MGLLILGLALWWGAHLFKRVAPGARADLQAKLGDGSKGVFAALLLVSVVLMVIGYRSAETALAYGPPAWGLHLNNLLMLVAVLLLGLGHSKSRLRATLRHPMLLSAVVWAVAHLLVNGTWDAVILFGGIGLWAAVEIVVINRAAPNWVPYAGGSLAGDLRLGGITVVAFGAFAAIHSWLGYWPFPG